MSTSRQIKLGAILSYVAIAINILCGILYTPWMISSIGRENFGLYTLANSVITLFVFDFGLSSAVTRFIARYLAEGRQDKADRCIGLVYRLYFVIDIVLLLIMTLVYFFIPYIYRELTADEIEKFKVIYVIAATYSVLSFPFIPVNGILKAHEKFIQLQLCDVLHKLFVVGSMAVCLLNGYGLYALVLVNAAAGIITILLKLFCIYKFTPQRVVWSYFDKLELKKIAGYSGWVTVISLSQRCIFSLAPSILGFFSGSAAIAVLGIAITIEAYTFTFANAINGMFLPMVARIVSSDKGNVLPLMIRVGRIQIFIVGLVVFGFLCLGNSFIYNWVGEEFSNSFICALLLIFPSFLHLPQQIGQETIYASNKVKKLAFVFIIMAVSNLLGAFLLAPSLGAVGICISIFIAYIVRTVGMDIIFYRDLQIDVFEFIKKTYLAVMAPLAVSVLVSLGIMQMVSIQGWTGFLIKGVLFCTIYLGITYKFSMNETERNLIRLPMKKIINKRIRL